MDPYATVPPLLSPRPDFLGAGWGRERANVFLELFSISFLYSLVPTPLSVNHHEIKDTQLSKVHSKGKSVDNSKDACNSKASSSRVGKAQDLETNTLKSTPHVEKHFQSSEDVAEKIPDCQTHRATSVVKGLNCMKKNSVDHTYSFKKETLELFCVFQKLKIPYETELYRPKEERLEVDKNIFYCKNLFLKDRKGKFFLIIFHEDTDMNLKQLKKTLNAYRNFNFATAEEMLTLLHTEPGGVTPLALMNESARNITMVISNSLVHDDAELMFHPMDARLATKLSLQNLLRFLKYFDHAVLFID